MKIGVVGWNFTPSSFGSFFVDSALRFNQLVSGFRHCYCRVNWKRHSSHVLSVHTGRSWSKNVTSICSFQKFLNEYENFFFEKSENKKKNRLEKSCENAKYAYPFLTYDIRKCSSFTLNLQCGLSIRFLQQMSWKLILRCFLSSLSYMFSFFAPYRCSRSSWKTNGNKIHI